MPEQREKSCFTTRRRCTVLGAAPFVQGDRSTTARRWKTPLARLHAIAWIRAMLEGKIREAEAN